MKSLPRIVIPILCLALLVIVSFTESFLDALLFGWWRVSERAAPRIEFNAAAVVTGVLCLAVTIVVLHRFCAWMYIEFRTKHDRADWPTAWRWRWTLGLIAAVVLMFSAGLMGVGLWRTTTWFLETPKIIERRSGVFDGH